MPPALPLAQRLLPFWLLLACLLVYLPGLSGGFLFDDFPNIVTNTRLHPSAFGWDEFVLAANGYEPGAYGRPLATIGFAIDYLIGQKDPWTYKVHSLIVHMVNTLLVFALLRRLLALPAAAPAWPNWSAAAMAALWAIHPLQVSTVLYVVQRMEMLAVLFLLLALMAYLRGRLQQIQGRSGWAWIAASGLLAAVGLLGKETAALFPAYALALELTVLRFEASEARTRRVLMAAYGIGIAVAVVLYVAVVLPQNLAPEAFAGRSFTVGERLLSQMRVLPLYLSQILLPLPGKLLFYYDDYAKSTGWLSPATTLAGALLIAALVAGAWLLRKRLPLAALGIFWFFASHLLTSNVFNLELVFEHRNYFALLGVLLALAAVARLIPVRAGSRMVGTSVLVLLLGFGGLAMIRSAMWGNPLLLAAELVARNPTSPRASSDLATLYVSLSRSDPTSPFFARGKAEFERGARLPMSSPLPEQGLILMAATTGQPVDDAWWDSLIAKLRLRSPGPQELMTVTGLVKQSNEGIPLDAARLSAAYEALLSHGGLPPIYYLQYADFAMTRLGDQALAERMYVAAVDSPEMDGAYALRVAGLLRGMGRERQAALMLARARERGLVDASQTSPADPGAVR